MRVLVAGSSGLIGKALVASLNSDGHDVVRLVRSGDPGPGRALWDPMRDRGPAPEAVEGVEAVVNFAGINLSDHRWTDRAKDGFRRSRTESTRLLCEAIVAGGSARVLVNASAVGYYGDRGNAKLDETSGRGQGFLAELCEEWEAATKPAEMAGIRVVKARFGAVLSAEGGALSKMIPPFKIGTGGWLGRGDQWVSWVSLVDSVRAVRFAIENEGVRGVVNVASPEPVTNKELARSLGRALHRPASFGIPRFAAHLVFGEVVDEVGFVSTRVYPAALSALGFTFEHVTVDDGVAAALKRGGNNRVRD